MEDLRIDTDEILTYQFSYDESSNLRQWRIFKLEDSLPVAKDAYLSWVANNQGKPITQRVFYFLADFIIMEMFTSFTQKPIPFVEENALHKLTSTDALGSFSNFLVFRKSFIECLYSIEAKERNNRDFK